MTPDLLAALAAFCFVSSVTPGPNNMMLLASGVNYGFRRTVPHMLGIGLGFAAMVVLVGLGLAGVFTAWPPARTVLLAASVAYMLWLAWRIAHASAPEAGAAGGRPMTFWQAAAFQWVNPKAWTMALGAITLYAPGQDPATVAVVAAVFVAVNVPTVAIWAGAGVALAGALRDPVWRRRFNWTMAAALVASLWPVLRG
jgi:threonine/homoserine/homoserine lactone efflux protein